MDPLELLELTDNLTDALDQLASADPDDALATLDAVEAVQAALEAMGENVQRDDPQPVVPPEPAINPLYQSVLDGAAVTIDLAKQVRAEGQKDPDHPQLRPAVRVIHSAVKAMAA